MPALAYCRVSSLMQTESGLGIEAQLDAVRRRFAYLKATRLPDLEWHHLSWEGDDGHFVDRSVSAYKTRLVARPAGAAMIRALRPGDHLILPKLDRAFRSLRDFSYQFEQWKKLDINVHICDLSLDMGTATGMAIAGMLAVFAEWESRRKGERIAEARSKRKRKAERKATTIWKASAAVITPDAPEDPAMPPVGKVYGYDRCSHVDSVKSGLGLSFREDQIKQRALLVGGNITTLFVDKAVSAYRHPLRGRVQGKALDEILKEGDHVIMSCLDRGFRNVLDLRQTWEAWHARGVHLHLCDLSVDMATPVGMCIAQAATLFGELEASMCSTRTKEAMARAKAEGRPRNGQTPTGFQIQKERINGKVIKQFVIDPKEIAKVRYVVAKRNQGMTWLAIAQSIEDICAARTGRRPLPRHGSHYLYAHKWGCVASDYNRKGDLCYPTWSIKKCQDAYKYAGDLLKLYREGITPLSRLAVESDASA